MNHRNWPPKAQRAYVNKETAQLGIFDCWSRWPYLGTYMLSTGAFVRLETRLMRPATDEEALMFARAKRVGVEAMATVPFPGRPRT